MFLLFHYSLEAVFVIRDWNRTYCVFKCIILFLAGRKPHVNVGTIGHVDHGKTTLTAAITKVSCSSVLISSSELLARVFSLVSYEQWNHVPFCFFGF